MSYYVELLISNGHGIDTIDDCDSMWSTVDYSTGILTLVEVFAVAEKFRDSAISHRQKRIDDQGPDDIVDDLYVIVVYDDTYGISGTPMINRLLDI